MSPRPFARSLALSLLAVGATLLASTAAPAAVLPADSTFILSGAPSLLSPLPAPVATSSAGSQSVSRSGRFVAFSSASDGLSSEDDDSVVNVYVRDQMTGTTTLVSRASGPNGAPAHASCVDPAISDDGTRVAFNCDGSLDPADTNNQPDLYLRDLSSDQTILVSAQGGVSGSDEGTPPALSKDGTRIAFESHAPFTAGVPGPQIYVRDVSLDPQPTLGPITLVSRGSGTNGALPDQFSTDPSISDDGERIAFLSHATTLAVGDNDTLNDVFVRDLSAATPTTTLVSHQSPSAGMAKANGNSTAAAISGGGTTVAFVSAATNLDPADLSGGAHVYRYLSASQTVTLIDLARGGTTAGNAAVSDSLGIDGSGSVIAFSSAATDLVDPSLDGSPAADTYVFDATGGAPTIKLVSRATGASSPAVNAPSGSSPSVSDDGREVLFGSFGSVTGDAIPTVATLALRDIGSDTTSAVVLPTGAASFGNEGGFAEFSSVSADGRYVAFETSAPAFGVPPTARSEIVVRDTETGAVTLASRADGANGAPMADAQHPSISADGKRVAFTTSDGGTTETAVWVRDLASGATILANAAPGGAPADGFVLGAPSLSADGNHVAFASSATNLVAQNTHGATEVYVRDLRPGGTTVLASVDNTGVPADNLVSEPSLSGDGTRVAFVTHATLLPTQDTDQLDDVYVHDLSANQTILASVGPNGAKADRNVEQPAISADGSHVAFDTQAANLGVPVRAGVNEVWVRDLRAGGTAVLASRVDGATSAPANDVSFGARISADGRFVAFASGASLVPGLPTEGGIYRRDLATGATQLLSRAAGADGAPLRADSEGTPWGGITADGGCVAFSASGDALGPVAGVFDYSQVYLRTFETNCGRPLPPPGGGSGGSGGSNDKDRTPPVLRSVSLTHKRFRVAKARTAVSAVAKRTPAIPRGTLLRLRTGEAGRLSIRIERARPGQKVRRGRTVTCKAVRRRPRSGACTAYAGVATLTRTIKAGRVQVALSGRVGSRALAPGSYRLTLTERDKAGNLSKAVRVSFTILRG